MMYTTADQSGFPTEASEAEETTTNIAKELLQVVKTARTSARSASKGSSSTASLPALVDVKNSSRHCSFASQVNIMFKTERTLNGHKAWLEQKIWSSPLSLQ